MLVDILTTAGTPPRPSMPSPEGALPPSGAHVPLYPFEWKGQRYYYSAGRHRILTEPVTPEERSAPAASPAQGVHVYKLYLNMTDGCNLCCDYCFSPPSGPGSALRMSREVIRASITQLARWWSQGSKRTPAMITFFGGEPLLNRDGLQYAVYFAEEWSREYGTPFSFSISTNGTLVKDDDIRFFLRHNIFVWFSIDGPAEVHDRRRRFRHASSSSHQLAIEHARQALHALPPYRVGVRATLSEGGGKLSEILDYLAEQGFRIISTAGVEPNQKLNCSLEEKSLALFAEDLNASAAALLRWRERGVKSSPLEQDLSSLQRGSPNGCFVCEAGRGSLAVNADGGLFPCHRFVNLPHYGLGNITGTVDLSRLEEFDALDFHTLPGCRDCWAQKFCLGPCVGATAAAGLPLGHPYEQHCSMRMLYTLLSLKCAAALGIGIENG